MEAEEQQSTRLSRLRRALPVLVAAAVAFGVVSGGPVTSASADPEPTGSSSADRPGGWTQVTRTVNGVVYRIWYNDALDPDDPHYRAKLAGQILVRRLVNRNDVGPPSPSELLPVLQDIQEYQRGVRNTVKSLKSEVKRRQNDIERYQEEVARATTPRARERAEKKLADARKAYNKVLPRYEKAKKRSAPIDWGKRISELEHRIEQLNRKAASPRYTEMGRKHARDEAARLRDELEETKNARDRSSGRDDDDPGGTTAKKDPKKPTTGPSTGAAKTTKGSTKAITPKKTETGKTGKTGKTGTPKTGSTGVTPKTGTTSVTPKTGATAVTPKTGTKVVTPNVGKWLPSVGPKTGVRGGSGLTSVVVAENGSLLVRGYLEAKHKKWYDKATKDPKLRAEIIADYEDLADNHVGEDIARAFDDSKEFAPGTSRAIGEDLKKYQASLDAAKKVADKSNADPLYQRARRECGGYDTCVQDRVKKLRDKNAKAIAKSDQDAKKSNADPLYQRARRECGGYDTCVKQRVKDLRAKAAMQPKKATTPERTTPKKAVTTPKKTTPKNTTPKIDPVLAKKQYEEASRVCGGYDTCVKDRLAKVRATGVKATTPKKAETPKKKTPAKKTKK